MCKGPQLSGSEQPVFDNDGILEVYISYFIFLVLLAKKIAVDLVILLGSSSSKIFTEQQGFIRSLLDKIKISGDSALVGVVLYGNPPQVKWKIGDIMSKEGTKRAVITLQNPGVDGDLFEALSLVNASLLNEKEGARPRTPKTILMFVSDNPVSEKTKMEDLAKSLKDRNVKIIIVSTGRKEDQSPLNAFAYDPHSFFSPPTLEELERVLKPVSIAVQPGIIFID